MKVLFWQSEIRNETSSKLESTDLSDPKVSKMFLRTFETISFSFVVVESAQNKFASAEEVIANSFKSFVQLVTLMSADQVSDEVSF
jgi:hypothetical protein